jgi:D-alanyl-D-alanine carboxypeptidase
MVASWRAGCPVPLRDLRYLTVTHLGFDGESRTGELVVHEDVADDVVEVFRTLYEGGFPIRSMRLVDDFGADDDRSMAADNTSAFNCRASTGSPGEWSQHSYGRAIDLNPRENPYVSGATVLPPAGTPYVNRAVRAHGLIRGDDQVVRAFAAIGWTWGGAYRHAKDYQHFSANGR